MANFYGTNSGAINTQRVGDFAKAAYQAGSVYATQDTFIAPTGDTATGSVIYVGKLPKGAIPLETLIYPIDGDQDGPDGLTTNAVTGTIGIISEDGNTSDANLLGTFTTLATVTPQVIYPTPDGTTHGVADPLTYDAEVTVTTADAAIPATEGFYIRVLYTVA